MEQQIKLVDIDSIPHIQGLSRINSATYLEETPLLYAHYNEGDIEFQY